MRSKEELDKERIGILQEISQLGDKNNSDNREEGRLQELQLKYNHIVDQTDEIHTLVLLDPLKVLPFELWETIIKDALYVEPGSNSSEHSDAWVIDRLLLLTRVSESWENAIITTPSFWTTITLLPETEDAAVKVALSLHLSGDSLLNVDIRFPIIPEIWNRLGWMVAAQSSRVRSITFFGPYPNPDDDAKIQISTIIHSFSSFSDLSSLDSLAYCRQGEGGLELDSVLLQAQNIRSLKGIKLPNKQEESASSRSLRYFETPDPVADVVPKLYQYGSLKGAIFSSTFMGTSGTTQLKEDVNLSTRPALPWDTLRIEQGILEGFESVLKLVTSSLAECKLSLSWDMLPQFIIGCSEAKRLESLTLTFPCPFAYGFETLPSLPPMIYLNTLNITLGDHLLYQKASTPPYAETPKGADDCFFSTLTTWAPFIRNLSIWTCTGRPSCHYYAESLRKLEKYSIRSWVASMVEGEPERGVNLPAVKDLNFVGYEVLFSVFNCPALVKLKADLNTHLATSEFVLNDALRLRPDPWCNVRSIDVNKFKTTWWSVPLPNLVTITVHNPATLIQALAQHPREYPSVNHLRFRSVPSWDILFIFLERRNFQADRNVSMIKTLSLPSIPSPIILSPLTDRLRGRYSCRPSNFRISMDCIGTLSLNINVLGCWLCHRCLAFCGGSPADLPTDYPFVEDMTLPTLPPYPDTDDEIVETGITRSDAWESCVSASGRTRIPTCNLRNGRELVDITGFTETGCFEDLVE